MDNQSLKGDMGEKLMDSAKIQNSASTKHSDGSGSEEIDFANEAAVYDYYMQDKDANQVVIFEGTVYNVKDYIPNHPGGGDLIEALLGKNIDADFEEREHTKKAKKLFNTFPVVGSVSVKNTGNSQKSAAPQSLSLMQGIDANIKLGGLEGKALKDGKYYPKDKNEVYAKIPKHLLQKDTLRSMKYAVISIVLTLMSGATGFYIPQEWMYAPVWLAYGFITGTIATGCWVVAHECGHQAFSDNKFLQTSVGYILHSACLVPYFSWQRSHAVHHANTNHVEYGETHVPDIDGSKEAKPFWWMKENLGDTPFGIIQMVVHLLFGWPAYILTGATGGPKYGRTNHFWPYFPFRNGAADLFPDSQAIKVLLSDIGIVVMAVILYQCAQISSWTSVSLIYGLPYLGVNLWLVLYTWLQHTDIDVPHFDSQEFTWAKGAFHTIDRPYGSLLNFLHHGIGSTHVAHHVNSSIPHYHAWEVTKILRDIYPDLCLYDPTPVHKALWRVCVNCVAVEKIPEKEGMYVYKLKTG